MANKIKFLSTNFRFDNTIPVSSKKNLAAWVFQGDADQIEHIHPGCGSCTTNCRVEGNVLLAEYEDRDSKNAVNRAEDPSKTYPNKIYAFTKNITVYLKDDEPLKIVNERGLEIFNTNKSRVVLNFGGYVDISHLLSKS